MPKSDILVTAPRLDLHGAFVRRTDLSNTPSRGADPSGADAGNAKFGNAGFAGAILWETVLRGADLTGAMNLTVEQLGEAILDATTILPDYTDAERVF